uniref:HORMA domain-containing protein n=1 Tax=Meloidogyne hapla TaxID=6305 RepID=A0A1I8BKB1_MELHA
MLDDKTIIVETKEVQTINDEEFKLDFSEKDSKLKKFLSKTVSTVCIYKKYKCNHKLKDTCKGEKYVESYYYKMILEIVIVQNNTPDPKPEFTYTFDFSKEEDQSKEINISVKLVDIPNELKKQMDRNSSFSSLPLASGGNTPRGPLTKGISRLLSFASSSSGKSSSKKVFENDAIPFVVDSENEDLQFPNNRSDIEGEQFDHSN